MKPDKDQLQRSILDILTEMTGDWELEEPLTPASTLSADLGFSSVDLLELLAALDMKLGRKLRYELLLVKEGQFRKDLSVADLAGFVDSHYEDVVSANPVAM